MKLFYKTSIIKTIRFNYHYFGLKYIFRPSILISRNCVFRSLKGEVRVLKHRFGCIRIGYGDLGFIDNKYQRTIWANTGTISFLGDADIGIGSRISCSGKIELGTGVKFNGNTSIHANKYIAIGDYSLISWDNLIMDTDFHDITRINCNENENISINPDADVIIGKHVWVGCRSTILKGVTIPDNVIIGAGSTVRKSIDSKNCIVLNQSVIKTDVNWKL